MNCKICSNPCNPIGSATVIEKYTVAYYACPNCGFIQTEEPYWLDEAYSHALTRGDVGGVRRQQALATITSQLLHFCLPSEHAASLDYGGGHGLFVRLMRDIGYAFEWQDRYAENIYARGFEQSRTSGYALLTTFELFEHLADPLTEIEQMLALSDTILFTTELVADIRPNLQEWWYYGLEHGQHIAIYSRQTLAYIAQKYGLFLHSNGSNIHMLTRRTVSGRRFRWLTRYKIAFALSLLSRRKSLIISDFEQLTGQRLQQ